MNSVLNRLKEISTAVMHAAEGTDLETVLERIAHLARELAGTKYAALGIPDGKGGLRYFKHAGMTDEQISKVPHLPRGHGLIGAIMQERESIRLDDMSDDERSYGFPEHHPPMHSFLGVPIQVSNQLYGMLYLSDKEDGEAFNEEDQLLIETLAGYAAVAIAGAELSQQKSRLRLLEERERIGMELHDGIIQSLYGIGMQVDILRQDNDQVPTTELSPVIDSLNDVIEDIREYITELRTRGSRQQSVKESIERLVQRLHPPRDLDITIDAPEDRPSFSPAVFESICLIINEAMSNAIRHAHADHIEIAVDQSRSMFNVIVRDDGKGFDVDVLNGQSGLGLRNMQQRARLYGGRVRIDTEIGCGTELYIDIPVKSY
jgi:signal transduction histidine kinase